MLLSEPSVPVPQIYEAHCSMLAPHWLWEINIIYLFVLLMSHLDPVLIGPRCITKTPLKLNKQMQCVKSAQLVLCLGARLSGGKKKLAFPQDISCARGIASSWEHRNQSCGFPLIFLNIWLQLEALPHPYKIYKTVHSNQFYFPVAYCSAFFLIIYSRNREASACGTPKCPGGVKK